MMVGQQRLGRRDPLACAGRRVVHQRHQEIGRIGIATTQRQPLRLATPPRRRRVANGRQSCCQRRVAVVCTICRRRRERFVGARQRRRIDALERRQDVRLLARVRRHLEPGFVGEQRSQAGIDERRPVAAGRVPRELSKKQMEALQAVARQVGTFLEIRKAAVAMRRILDMRNAQDAAQAVDAVDKLTRDLQGLLAKREADQKK